MARSQLISAQQVADQDAATTPSAIVGGTFVRLLNRDRIWGGSLTPITVADLGFLIAVKDVVCVHVSTTDDGVWEFVPLNATS